MQFPENQEMSPEFKAIMEEDKDKNGKPDFFEDNPFNVFRKLVLLGKNDYKGIRKIETISSNQTQKPSPPSNSPNKALSGEDILRILLLIGVLGYVFYYFFTNR